VSPLLREAKDFRAAIERAAEIRGLGDPSFVEKDYWVTEALRVLATDHPHDITFKGGTSLSKGYGIIERFSEDIDILVVPDGGASNRDREAKLLSITENVADRLNLRWEEHRSPGRGRDSSRGDLILFSPQYETIAALAPGVVLETGYGEGHEPKEVVQVSPLVGAVPELEGEGYADIEPFPIGVLEPRRTLIEKLYAVHNAGVLFLNGDEPPRRIGRHFYDIYQLLEHDDTKAKLERDRERFGALCTEVERISQARFGGVTPRPSDGFAASPVFTAESGSDLRKWLEEQYSEVQTLIVKGADTPSLGAILKRVEERGGLL
jgi:hypothetical protein